MKTISAGPRAGFSDRRRVAPAAPSAGVELWLPPQVVMARRGAEITAQRELHGWSQAELARRVGVPRATLQRWERDVLELTAEQRAALDRALAIEDPPEVLDPLGKRRSPITVGSYRRGQPAPNAGRTFPPEPLTAAEIAALLAALGKGKSGTRDQALTVVLWRSGVRIAEALALYLKDVDVAAGTVTVLRGKGGRRRTVGIDALTVGYLQRWLQVRARLGIGESSPLFCTITKDTLGPGRPLNSSAFRNTLKGAAKKAGIAKRVHPHGMRHTHAFELAVEGVPLDIVRNQLGHADLGMTQRYISHLAPTAVIDAIRRRECPPELMPPQPVTPVATLSQGAPAPKPREPIPPRVLAGDPPATLPVSGPRAPDGAPGQQRVLDLLAVNPRLSQVQIAQALGIGRSTASNLLGRLQAKGLVISTGYQRVKGRPPARIWRLAPPKVRVTVDEPHDPRERSGSIARRGFGRDRVLAAITGAEGRASQAQLARQLGVGADTVRKHCEALEREGKLTRGGLDKSTSNHGSPVWRLPQAVRYSSSAPTRVTFAVAASAR